MLGTTNSKGYLRSHMEPDFCKMHKNKSTYIDERNSNGVAKYSERQCPTGHLLLLSEMFSTMIRLHLVEWPMETIKHLRLLWRLSVALPKLIIRSYC